MLDEDVRNNFLVEQNCWKIFWNAVKNRWKMSMEVQYVEPEFLDFTEKKVLQTSDLNKKQFNRAYLLFSTQEDSLIWRMKVQ